MSFDEDPNSSSFIGVLPAQGWFLRTHVGEDFFDVPVVGFAVRANGTAEVLTCKSNGLISVNESADGEKVRLNPPGGCQAGPEGVGVERLSERSPLPSLVRFLPGAGPDKAVRSCVVRVEDGLIVEVGFLRAPVLLDVDGERQLLVFPDAIGAGYCTARAGTGRRCRNFAWEHGQVTYWVPVLIGDRLVEAYGPLPPEAVETYLEQRCPHHRGPCVAVFCDPEWEPFDLERHYALTYDLDAPRAPLPLPE
ncbi:hypothetical protein ACIBCT_39130 [Streptosporangium sp. NPDC050855]|uniref:hypothetical protein n=1 Tax=Streptosporangium sp. NPDC050855 TaxID=3366194 RepID=UPI0037909AA8